MTKGRFPKGQNYTRCVSFFKSRLLKVIFTVDFTKLLTGGLRSSIRTWEFHYVTVNQMANFETNLGIWEFRVRFK